MGSQLKRLIWAAMLSAACFGATLFWYKSTERKNSGSENETPIAQVSKVGDEVLKRSSTRLLWSAVNTGDSLFNGETIRTSSKGEIRIQFEDGRYIDLESDSLVVLQKSKGEIALDLMEGSLFVNAKADGGQNTGSAPGLVLNSKSGKIDLSGASASLSKGKGDALDLQVLEGKAKIQGKDGQSKEVGGGFNSNAIQILSPKPGAVTYIDADAENNVSFKWQGFDPKWKVALFIGQTRKQMKDWATTEDAGKTEMATKIALGKYFIKLVAKDPVTSAIVAESNVQKIELAGRNAPTIIFPLSDAEIPAEKSPFDMKFQWQKGEETSKVQIEVAKDQGLKKIISNKAFAKEESFTLPALAEGTYYWRMSSYFIGSDKPLIGKVQRFEIKKITKVPPKQPAQIVWTIPDDQITQYYSSKPNLSLSWDAITRKEEITQYQLKLSPEQSLGDESVRVDTTELKAVAEVKKQGRYIASIEAFDKDGNVIGKSDPKTISATELPLLAAPKLLPEEGPLKAGNDGKSNLNWEKIQGAKEYWLTILDSTGKELAKQKYEGTTTQLKNLMPGEYKVKLTSVDSIGRVGPDGAERTLIVPEKSNLKAPSLKRVKVN